MAAAGAFVRRTVGTNILGYILKDCLALGDVSLGLGGEQLVVAAALGHELAVVALLNELAVLQDCDLGYSRCQFRAVPLWRRLRPRTGHSTLW